ncbi:MAG: hypothetical protein K6E32_06965 [Lachnospiraceae bacterium]|nr:hypothetical protein [Lachnospiraceae bacterium]
MSFFSIPVMALICISVPLYFLLPRDYRWCSLLFCSIGVIIAANPINSAIFVCVSVAVVYISAVLVEKGGKIQSNLFFALGVVFCLTSVGLLKTFAWTGIVGNYIIAPIGVSYYMFSVLGYLIDVKRGICAAEKNPFKFFLFATFFPCLLSGPIIRYSNVKAGLFEGHSFDLRRIVFGAERMIWGLFKKLVISDRMAVIVNNVFVDYSRLSGAYILFGILLFPIQLYADFSGCIDIIMGIAEIFGVILPENFELPFLSRSVAEFWRKWHITMGQWLRDYVFYTLLRSSLFKAINKNLSKKMDRKRSMKIVTWIALFITWVCIGTWHGGVASSIFGVGIFFGVVIILGEAFDPVMSTIKEKLGIKQESIGFRLFQYIRTFLLFAIGNSFFRQQAGLKEGFDMWIKVLINNGSGWYGQGSFIALGLDTPEWIALMVSVFVMVIAGLQRVKLDHNLRVAISDRNPVISYVVWLCLIVMIILFGWYGEGYSTQTFIYQQF